MRHALRLICAISLLLPFRLAAAEEEELVFCYDPYPPYTFEAVEGAEPGGLKAEMLQAVVDRIEGVSARLILLPWARCQAEAKSGAVDGVLPLYRNDERDAYLALTTAVLDQSAAIWRRVDNSAAPRTWSGDYDDFGDLTLGMLQGSYIERELENAFAAEDRLMRAPTVEGLMLMLYHGRLDLVAIDAFVGEHITRQRGWSDAMRPFDVPIGTKPAFFGLSRAAKADRYLAAFNTSITALRASGEMDALTAKYIRIDGRPAN
ncbi:MAG: transporter substrate-binding domain-containing protein [Pseudomonadota bacterium]